MYGGKTMAITPRPKGNRPLWQGLNNSQKHDKHMTLALFYGFLA
jgi:hypothetical protein